MGSIASLYIDFQLTILFLPLNLIFSKYNKMKGTFFIKKGLLLYIF
jgi:hypothetical protein